MHHVGKVLGLSSLASRLLVVWQWLRLHSGLYRDAYRILANSLNTGWTLLEGLLRPLMGAQTRLVLGIARWGCMMPLLRLQLVVRLTWLSDGHYDTAATRI